MKKVWKWIDHNRWVIIGPIVGLMLWAFAVSCTPLTPSPLDPGRKVDIVQLELDFKTWQAEQEIMAARFEIAGQDLEQQKANNAKIKETILTLATGGIPDTSGLLKLLIGGGGLGAIVDNIRKGGVIGGLKKKSQGAVTKALT